MRTLRRDEGANTYFIITGVDPAYHDAVCDLGYEEIADGFGKAFPLDTPNLDRIYHRFRSSAEEMVYQAAGAEIIPWQLALDAFAGAIEGESIDWWLTGSAALAIRGIELKVRDIDLVVDPSSAVRLGNLLLEHLIEPVVQVDGWIAMWFGSTFLHTRIEWIAGVHEWVDKPEPSDFGPVAESQLEVLQWQGRHIWVPPVSMQLAVSKSRGLSRRVEQIERYLMSHK